ncbi:MarR family winged helix-turn-helix transcriptional regulator [Cupriavidus gilardii]|uniref:MarR family winged helix-turn-helix transcriptional regulator n=1 Tax=Cupriavidus gilardii TaxID=82541 RepID=UPI0021C082D3|nr:MarR family transcriptional regulator [Cupriavidus gilardii]MCT9123762.1 MarR family transcriptional regulator [Cupriavidus gilardii]
MSASSRSSPSSPSSRSPRKTRDTLAPDPATEAGGFDPHLPDVDYGVLDNLIGYAIRRAQIRLYEDFVRSLAPWNITPPRFSALVLISRNPDLKLTDLARIMGIARSGAVLLVDALEEMKLVARRPAENDRRAFSLVLTAAGRRTLEAATEAVCKHDAKMARALSAQEQQTLRALLARLA